MSKKLVKSYAIVLVTVLLITCITWGVLYRPSIKTATIEELTYIEDIGEVLALDIHLYLKNNPTCSIEDLSDIDYIGPSRIKNIKKRYGD